MQENISNQNYEQEGEEKAHEKENQSQDTNISDAKKDEEIKEKSKTNAECQDEKAQNPEISWIMN
jgi:hypothetical protein